MAKKRKVDSLAEVIRQKQELKSLKSGPMSTGSLQPQALPVASSTPIFSPKNRRKNEQTRSPVRLTTPNPPAPTDTAIAASLLSLQPQPMSELFHHHKRSENNNVLSSLANLKLPPSIQLPTKPVAGLTPPSSPPPPSQIRGEVSVTIVGGGGGAHSDDSDNEAENGLDLSISKRRNSDEHEVSTTAHPSDFYGRLALPPHHPAPPHHQLPPPFPFLPPLPPGAADHHPALAEHLLKLASLQPRGPLPPPPELPKVPNSSPYTVLSAMLGHHTTSHFPTVFPGMPSVFPSTSAASPAGLPLPIKEEPQIGKNNDSFW